jgi:hypothetical protein
MKLLPRGNRNEAVFTLNCGLKKEERKKEKHAFKYCGKWHVYFLSVNSAFITAAK